MFDGDENYYFYMNKGITERIELKVQGKETLEIRITADNYLIDWGDGIQSKECFHAYISSKEKTVIITGEKIFAFMVKGKGVVYLKTSNCRSLHHLTSSDCSLSNMELDCINLRGLSVQNNLLKQLKVNSTSLDWLICDNNNLQDLDLSYQERLIFLSCKFNYLEKLQLSKSNQILKNVLCTGNNLGKEELQRIISSLPKSLPYCGYLLDCSLNPGVDEVDFSILDDMGWKVEESFNENFINRIITKLKDMGYIS